MESPEFPTSMRSHGANGGVPKRKRSIMDSSPGSIGHHDIHDHDHEDDDHDDASPETKGRRLPGVKRACNECRQQKV